MPHPLVLQYQFAREKWQELLKDMPAEHAQKKYGRINTISWTVAHLGQAEQLAFLEFSGHDKVTDVYERYDIYKPNVSPPYDEMMEAWQQVSTAVDPILNTLTEDDLQDHPIFNGKPIRENIGTWLLRLTAHLWYHNGEMAAILQLCDDRDLPQMVGSIPHWATYSPD